VVGAALLVATDAEIASLFWNWAPSWFPLVSLPYLWEKKKKTMKDMIQPQATLF